MKLQNSDFKIGFWHPFGPHAGETREEIIARKRKEIVKNGWTLWSFQHRPRATFDSWYKQIQIRRLKKVLVFCSNSEATFDPVSPPKLCTYYVPVNTLQSKAIPANIEVSHPMGGKTRSGSAFIVKRIIQPVSFGKVPIEWFSKGKWKKQPLPTRPEYLIRPGKGALMREVYAILELKHPYLVEVGR